MGRHQGRNGIRRRHWRLTTLSGGGVLPPPGGSVSMETVTETAPHTQAAPAGVKVFELSDAGIDFGRVEALKQVTLDVHEGERIAVIGPSGASKTTLFRMLAAVIK